MYFPIVDYEAVEHWAALFSVTKVLSFGCRLPDLLQSIICPIRRLIAKVTESGVAIAFWCWLRLP